MREETISLYYCNSFFIFRQAFCCRWKRFPKILHNRSYILKTITLHIREGGVGGTPPTVIVSRGFAARGPERPEKHTVDVFQRRPGGSPGHGFPSGKHSLQIFRPGAQRQKIWAGGRTPMTACGGNFIGGEISRKGAISP
jgi:hypothetical protein